MEKYNALFQSKELLIPLGFNFINFMSTSKQFVTPSRFFLAILNSQQENWIERD